MTKNYDLPPGQEWNYVGDCCCRGQDGDCVDDDSQWEVVDSNGFVVRPAKKPSFWRRLLKALAR